MKKHKTLFAAFLVVVMVCALALVACKDPVVITLQSISVNTDSVKQEYVVGEQFSSEGLVVKAVLKHSDQETPEEKVLETSEYTLDSSAFKSDTVGSYTIKVSYTYGETTKAANFTVKVKAIEYDGLYVALATGVAATYTLSETAKTVEIDTSKIVVKEVGVDGLLIDAALTGYTVELYRGVDKVNLTDGKATVGEGAYQIWVSKASDKVENYTRKAFVTVYVLDNAVSLAWDSSAEGTVVSQKQGEDVMTATWKFTVTYASGATKQVGSESVTFSPAVDTSKAGDVEVSATYTEANAKGEKQTTSEAKVAFTVKKKGGEPIVSTVNVSEMDKGDIAEAKVLASGITILATADKKVTVDGNAKSIDGFEFTQRMKLGGTGSVTYRSVKLEVSAASDIVVYAQSSSSSEDRILGLFNEAGEKVGEQTAPGASIGKLTYSVEGAGTYYIWSVSSGINIYYISVETETVASQPKTVSVNVNDIQAGNIVEETQLCEGVYAMGTSAKAIVVESHKKDSADGTMSFTQRLKLGGKGSVSERSLKIVTTGPATVTLYAITSSGSDENRTFSLYDSEGNIVEGSTTIGIPNAVTKIEIAIPEAGTFYIWGTNGINLYYIAVTTK